MNRTGLALQKCWNHPSREAVARCPECGHSYCRECVVEHHDRIICAGCLARLVAADERSSRKVDLAPLWRTGAAAAGFVLAWFLFFIIGRSVLSVPDDFHASRYWHQKVKTMMDEDP